MKLAIILMSLLLPIEAVAQNSSAKPDVRHAYLMPCEQGAEATVRHLSAVETRRGQHLNMMNFTSWEFAFKKPVAVYAAREGVVVDADAERNRITVEHSDGTTARYFALESIAVTTGEHIDCTTLLGQASQAAYDTWVVGFELFHRYPNPNTDPQRSITARYDFLEEYIDPVFRTRRGKLHLVEGGTYKSVRHRNWLGIWR